MGSMSIWHWLIVLAVVVMIIGTKKLRNVGQDLGGAVKGFKEGMKDDSDAAARFDAPDPMEMMRPNARSRIPGSAARVVHHADVRLSVSVRSKLSSSPVNGSW